MSYVSIRFIVFFCVFFVAYFCAPKKIRWGILLVSNYVFYMLAIKEKWTVVFLIASTVSIYLVSRKFSTLDKKREQSTNKCKDNKNDILKKRYLIVGITFNVLLLVILKYSNYIITKEKSFGDIIGCADKLTAFNIIVPIGISIYTLQAIGYLIDVYRNKYDAEKNIFKLALFLSYFPCITQGPICRYDKVSQQLCKPHRVSFDRLKEGMTYIFIGILKKIVIADRINYFVEPILNEYSKFGGVTLFFAGLLNMLQIYMAFSGFIDISMGISKIIGVELEANFKRPFLARNIKDFFYRWNISLNMWMKDYVYQPFVKSNRFVKIKKEKDMKKDSILINVIFSSYALFWICLITGIWHGANIKFIILGLFYYILALVGCLFKPVVTKFLSTLHIKTNNIAVVILQILKTSCITYVAMLIYRMQTVSDVFTMISRIFNNKGSGILLVEDFNRVDIVFISILVVIMYILGIISEKGKNLYKCCIDNRCLVIKYIVYLAILLTIVLFGVYGVGIEMVDFIFV